MAFSIKFKNSAKSLVADVKKAVKKNNGKFSGDETEGNIEIPTPLGKISGVYQIDGQKAKIEILKKPFLLSEERIKKELLKMLK